jgi:hypothetical protein
MGQKLAGFLYDAAIARRFASVKSINSVSVIDYGDDAI